MERWWRKRKHTSSHFACVVGKMNAGTALQHLITLWIWEKLPFYGRWGRSDTYPLLPLPGASLLAHALDLAHWRLLPGTLDHEEMM